MTHKNTSRAIGARLATLISASVLAFTLSGCANSANDVDQLPAEPEVSAPADEGDAVEPAPASLGTLTVGTTTYTVVDTVNCEPASGSDLITRTLDVIAVGQSSDGDEALFFAYTDEQNGVASSNVDYQGPEGTFASMPGAATLQFEDGMVSGASPIVDEAETQTVMVQFSFEVSADLEQC